MVQKTPRETDEQNKQREGKRPSLDTKKVEPLEEEQQNNAYERIWKNDIEPSDKKKSAEQVVPAEKVASPVVQEDDSKPKFMLRRRTNNPPEEPKKENSIVTGKDNHVKKV